MFGWLRGSSPSCFLGGIIRSSLLYLPVLRRGIPLIEAFKQYIESIQNTLTDRYSYFLSGLFMVKMRRETKFSQVPVCQYLNEAVGISPILLPRAFFLLCFLKPPSGYMTLTLPKIRLLVKCSRIFLLTMPGVRGKTITLSPYR